jgi:CRISPR/Cas system CMR-associated protein Cmr1 (group 7 of RAMP superfamily)
MLNYYENAGRIFDFMNSIGLYTPFPEFPLIIKNLKESEYRIFSNKKRECSTSFTIKPPVKNTLQVTFTKQMSFTNSKEFETKDLESSLFDENEHHYSFNVQIKKEMCDYLSKTLQKLKPEIDETFHDKDVNITVSLNVDLKVLGNGRDFDFSDLKRTVDYNINTVIMVASKAPDSILEELNDDVKPMSLERILEIRKNYPVKSYKDKSCSYSTKLFSN